LNDGDPQNDGSKFLICARNYGNQFQTTIQLCTILNKKLQILMENEIQSDGNIVGYANGFIVGKLHSPSGTSGNEFELLIHKLDLNSKGVKFLWKSKFTGCHRYRAVELKFCRPAFHNGELVVCVSSEGGAPIRFF